MKRTPPSSSAPPDDDANARHGDVETLRRLPRDAFSEITSLRDRLKDLEVGLHSIALAGCPYSTKSSGVHAASGGRVHSLQPPPLAVAVHRVVASLPGGVSLVYGYMDLLGCHYLDWMCFDAQQNTHNNNVREECRANTTSGRAWRWSAPATTPGARASPPSSTSVGGCTSSESSVYPQPESAWFHSTLGTYV